MPLSSTSRARFRDMTCPINLAAISRLPALTRQLRPDQALVFWLSGFSPDPATSVRHAGSDPCTWCSGKGAQIVNGMVP